MIASCSATKSDRFCLSATSTLTSGAPALSARVVWLTPSTLPSIAFSVRPMFPAPRIPILIVHLRAVSSRLCALREHVPGRRLCRASGRGVPGLLYFSVVTSGLPHGPLQPECRRARIHPPYLSSSPLAPDIHPQTNKTRHDPQE